MKILALEHTQPLPVWHVAPDSALAVRRQPWFVPDDAPDGRCTASLWLAAVISRLGRDIAPRFASRYYATVAVAAHPHIDAPGIPSWARDGAVILSDSAAPAENIPADMRSHLDHAVALASKMSTLKTGDLILLPLPHAPIALAAPNDISITPVDGAPTLSIRIR